MAGMNICIIRVSVCYLILDLPSMICNAQGGAAAADTKAAEGNQGGGRFRAIIDTVIGNLQLSITNVHIRFEVCTCMRLC